MTVLISGALVNAASAIGWESDNAKGSSQFI